MKKSFFILLTMFISLPVFSQVISQTGKTCIKLEIDDASLNVDSGTVVCFEFQGNDGEGNLFKVTFNNEDKGFFIYPEGIKCEVYENLENRKKSIGFCSGQNLVYFNYANGTSREFFFQKIGQETLDDF